jgi:DNA/RNA-binding domain of Phe-tRNA-synthetase-like protein
MSFVALPDGKTVTLDASVSSFLKCGIVLIEDVKISDGDKIQLEILEFSKTLETMFANLKPSEIPGLAEARKLYRHAGMDPTRTRPSSEALLRRVLKGKDLYQISNAVDMCNLASLEFLLPIGMYDYQKIDGDITLRIGSTGEQYAGIRKGPVHIHNRLALFDGSGGFGSPTSDSLRTSVTDETTCLLAVIMSTAEFNSKRLAENSAHFAHLAGKYCSAKRSWFSLLPEE